MVIARNIVPTGTSGEGGTAENRDDPEDRERQGDGAALGGGIAVGLAVGVAIGILMDELATGVALGLVLGPAFGVGRRKLGR